VKLIFAGSAEESIVSLKAVLRFCQEMQEMSGREPQASASLLGVLTNPDRKMGRGGKVQPNPVKRAAMELGVKKFWETPEELLELSGDERPDLGVVVAYGKIFSPETLKLPKLGWINLHFSLLPKYRGAAPVQAAILAGETETGVSVFQLEEEMDTGPVFVAMHVTIEPEENASELLERLSQIGADALSTTLRLIISGTAFAQPQVGFPTYSKKFTTQDAEIDFTQSAEQVVNQIRAFTVNPGAYFNLDNGSRIIVEQAKLVEWEDFSNTQVSQLDISTPGNFIVAKSHVVVSCLNSIVELVKVRPAGKSSMPAVDWARGLRNTSSLKIID
jgi:methionyl-tRNA formyltransferase